MLRFLAFVLCIACFGGSFVDSKEFGGILSALGLFLFGLSAGESSFSPRKKR